jgi:hypothetical protein
MGQDEGRSSRELIEQQKRNGANFLLRLDIHWVGATKLGEPRGVAPVRSLRKFSNCVEHQVPCHASIFFLSRPNALHR